MTDTRDSYKDSYGEVLTPEAAAREKLSNEMFAERESFKMREGLRWRALAHVLIVFMALSLFAFAAVVCASTFGVMEAAVGIAGAGGAAVIALVYIHVAANRTIIRSRD